ncbi:hypothetical protein TorRG33x02_184810 [Trema orientale]|uniref:Uncharacterized protein n=1 Tax=Trema orientale TaxID=63057 RepID=A0A2P5EJN3_TREOI|nr:hypothetical protein TorRG33x02_184810 [Trema orientale]
MQTAVGVFGGEARKDEVSVHEAPRLMVENVGNSGRPATTSLNSPPFIAVELCRERLGVHPCDKRSVSEYQLLFPAIDFSVGVHPCDKRSVSEYQLLFPAIDFSVIENEEDILWKPDVRETNEELAARGLKFLNW